MMHQASYQQSNAHVCRSHFAADPCYLQRLDLSLEEVSKALHRLYLFLIRKYVSTMIV